MRRTLLLALVASACGGGASPPAGKPDDACPAYALRVAETFYIGFERGGPQARYVKPEFIAGVSARMLALCKGLPVAHTRCVANADTSAEADRCPLDPATLEQLTRDMNEVVRAEADRAMNLHASADECAAAAAVQRELMAPAGIPLPGVDQLAAICRDGSDWTADFVRCLVATKSNDCKSLPGVKADVTRLVQDHLAAQ